jgi:hypothetical protein
VLDDGRAVRLCVEAPAGGPMERNVLRGGAIALTCVAPTTYRSVQIKGVVRDAARPTRAHRDEALDHRERFCAEVVLVGVPVDRADRFMWDDALLSVTFAVRELYDQTPGPAAGGRL